MIEDLPEPPAVSLAKADASDPEDLALKMRGLFLDQAQKLNSMMTFLVEARESAEKATTELAKLRSEVLTHRQVIEEVKTLARDALTLERQRLAKERDEDHQRQLGRIPGITERSPVAAIAFDVQKIFDRLDKIDEGLRAQGRLTDPPTPRPVMEAAAQALREKAEREGP